MIGFLTVFSSLVTTGQAAIDQVRNIALDKKMQIGLS
jgi:hypothetical protein